MRVALVVHQFPPHAEAGTEILCLRTAQALLAAGDTVRVFATRPDVTGGEAATDTFEGIDVVRIPARRPRRWSFAARLTDEFDNPDAATTLIDAVSAFRPDVIHLHHALHLGLTALPRLGAVAPLIVTATDFHLACPVVTAPAGHTLPNATADAEGASCLAHVLFVEAPRAEATGGLKGWLMRARLWLARSPAAHVAMRKRRAAARAGLGAASAILAGSPRIAAALAEAGAPAERLEILPHTAPPLAVPAKPVGTPLVAGMLATLATHKGQQVFLDAIALIPREHPLRFIVGGPPGADAAFAAAIRARVALDERIAWRDPVPNTQFGALLGELDIAVFPSLWDENRPLTLLAALEAGRYAVVSDRPGLATEIASSEQGVTFPAGDAAALARALIALAEDDTPVRSARSKLLRPSGFGGYVEMLKARYAAAASAR